MLKESHTILVVDDEPAIVRMLERLLRREFRVLTASSGKEALEILRREKVSMIITDQRMPGMTGTELLRESRAIDPDIVRIVITANNDADTFIAATKDSGAIKVIGKPWDPDKVLETVRAALEKYELFMENKRAINEMKQVTRDLSKFLKRE